MGALTRPITFRNAGSMNPMAPQRRTSMGRMYMLNLMDLRALIEEEVARYNYPLKLKN